MAVRATMFTRRTHNRAGKPQMDEPKQDPVLSAQIMHDCTKLIWHPPAAWSMKCVHTILRLHGSSYALTWFSLMGCLTELVQVCCRCGSVHGSGTGNPRKYVDVAWILDSSSRLICSRGRASGLGPPRTPPFEEIAHSWWILRYRTWKSIQ